MEKISFTVNGESYSITGPEVSSTTSLNEYLRQHLNARGTKAMCHEGGCGACVVAVTAPHPLTKDRQTFSVNSCLVSVLSCHGWDIRTVEGLGSRKDGYHTLQQRLATFNGTQCGFCTPGWVMSMYSLTESKKNLTMSEIENSFASNMCRCTGYRPILDAFKSLASDASEDLISKIQDLEDLANLKCLKSKKEALSRYNSIDGEDWCLLADERKKRFMVETRENRWYKVYKIKDIFKVLNTEGYDSYRLIAGNTGQGVYHLTETPKTCIDISSIEKMKDYLIDVNLIIGANITLNEAMDLFKRYSETTEDFRYLKEFYDHLDLVAHVPVRNIGTIGGNLAMKNQYNEFPSDVFLLLATVGAYVTIVDKNLQYSDISMEEFMKTDIGGKVIVNIKLPPLSHSCFLRTYKIMPRAQNAHAIVNAGFLYEMTPDGRVKRASIVYGGISPQLVHATHAEQVIAGNFLFRNLTLKVVLEALDAELKPTENPPEPSGLSRKLLALGLFYKSVISFCPTNELDPRIRSGGEKFLRPVSKGVQYFETDKSLWPLNKPIPKLEALIQCSGEANYANDLPTYPREVFASFVLSTVASGAIDYVDATKALKIPGVLAYYSSKDIPGKNSFTPQDVPNMSSDEEILCSSRIKFYGQPVGIIVATTEKLAYSAAHKVVVHYKNVKTTKPILTIRDAINAPKSENRVRRDVDVKATDKGEDSRQVIKGRLETPSQYHYTMEPQSCVVVPGGDALEVHPSTQWMDLVHVAVAQALNIPENTVRVAVSRVGGAYGGKASRSAQVACACALVAHLTARPARLVLPIQTNMAAVGKRQASLCEYEVGINDAGEVQYANLKVYEECGASYNDTSTASLADCLARMYGSRRWSVQAYSVLTDKPTSTWCRAPGTMEATAILEHIMERIGHALHKDIIDIKLANIPEENNKLKEMITSFRAETEYDSRLKAIATFNNSNKWRKRSIRLVSMSYPIVYDGNFAVTISVFHADGTIAISHGGIEMGQGINTKVAQVCAHELGVELDMVKVLASNNFVSPNAIVSSGSITSESLAYATIKACEDLKERLQPTKDELTNPSWKDLIKKAFSNNVNLQASYMMSSEDRLQGYSVCGVAVAEVELDVLTGTHQVLRVDILEDCGQSLSPEIDVGQIEGAFMMGLGLWTSEQLVYDAGTGKLLTDRTWTYKPPGAKDTPQDFRIKFQSNSLNPAGVLRSKATGEPALVMAVVLTHALRESILEARREFGYVDTEWLEIGTPYTVENILTAIHARTEDFQLKYVNRRCSVCK